MKLYIIPLFYGLLLSASCGQDIGFQARSEMVRFVERQTVWDFQAALALRKVDAKFVTSDVRAWVSMRLGLYSAALTTLREEPDGRRRVLIEVGEELKNAERRRYAQFLASCIGESNGSFFERPIVDLADSLSRFGLEYPKVDEQIVLRVVVVGGGEQKQDRRKAVFRLLFGIINRLKGAIVLEIVGSQNGKYAVYIGAEREKSSGEGWESLSGVQIDLDANVETEIERVLVYVFDKLLGEGRGQFRKGELTDMGIRRKGVGAPMAR